MRRQFTLFSVVVHAVVIAAALVAQQFDVVALPTPRHPLLFDAADIMPADIHLPAPRSAVARRAAGSENAVEHPSAPAIVPTGVTPETERIGTSTAAGPIEGVETGTPAGIEGLWSGSAPAPPPPAVIPPMRLHHGMKAPSKTVDVQPVYPAVAQRARVDGVVILEAVIDAQGHVASVRVLRSIALLDQAAADAVRQWRFTPALLDGEPVPVVMTVTVNFTLHNR